MVRVDAARLEWIRDRRWFAGKGLPVEDVRVIDDAEVASDVGLTLALIEVAFRNGERHVYHLPLVVDADGSLRDGLDQPDSLKAIGGLMGSHASIRGRRGTFTFAAPGLDPLATHGRSVRLLSGEQSHTSFVLDDDVIVKLFRRVARGPNPDLELTRLLTNEGFEHVPAQLGEAVYHPDEGPQIDIAIAQQFVADARGGWEIAQQEIAALLKRATHSPKNVLEVVEAEASDVLEAIEDLGDVTASLHTSLALEERDPEFAAEPIEVADLKSWVAQATEYVELARASSHAAVTPLLDRIERRIEQLVGIGDAGAKIRIHGDYHLGQVLLSPRGWLVIDFEGEPARPLDERRAKHSPLKDVAGMLRSLSYAAAAALRASPASDPIRESWADAWEQLARERFTAGYLRRSHERHWLPPDADSIRAMVDIFEAHKALYELDYETRNRPDWIDIPIRGLQRLSD